MSAEPSDRQPGATPGSPGAGKGPPGAGASPAPSGPGMIPGTASEADELFCRIAARSGLLEPLRAAEALAAAHGREPGAAAALCVARGWLTEAQARALQASVESAAGASPGADGAGAREFGRLVEMKRLAEDGRVEACLTIQKELAGTPYARLGELLVQRARRRASGAPSSGIGSRQQAFDAYVKLKQAVQRGAVDEAARLAALLQGHPEFGRVSQVQLERARTRRALLDGGLAGRQPGQNPGPL